MRLEAITVTKEDIMAGMAENCHWCPVALALRRHFGGRKQDWEVDADFDALKVIGEGRWKPARKVKDFMHMYDEAEKYNRPSMKPFTFHIWRLPQYA